MLYGDKIKIDNTIKDLIHQQNRFSLELIGVYLECIAIIENDFIYSYQFSIIIGYIYPILQERSEKDFRSLQSTRKMVYLQILHILAISNIEKIENIYIWQGNTP